MDSGQKNDLRVSIFTVSDDLLCEDNVLLDVASLLEPMICNFTDLGCFSHNPIRIQNAGGALVSSGDTNMFSVGYHARRALSLSTPGVDPGYELALQDELRANRALNRFCRRELIDSQIFVYRNPGLADLAAVASQTGKTVAYVFDRFRLLDASLKPNFSGVEDIALLEYRAINQAHLIICEDPRLLQLAKSIFQREFDAVSLCADEIHRRIEAHRHETSAALLSLGRRARDIHHDLCMAILKSEHAVAD